MSSQSAPMTPTASSSSVSSSSSPPTDVPLAYNMSKRSYNNKNKKDPVTGKAKSKIKDEDRKNRFATRIRPITSKTGCPAGGSSFASDPRNPLRVGGPSVGSLTRQHLEQSKQREDLAAMTRMGLFQEEDIPEGLRLLLQPQSPAKEAEGAYPDPDKDPKGWDAEMSRQRENLGFEWSWFM